MKINNKQYRTIWEADDNPGIIQIIDQTKLPHQFSIKNLTCLNDFVNAIKDMEVRGAPLIGVTAAYGMYIAGLEAVKTENFKEYIVNSAKSLISTRPTAINLNWAVNQQLQLMDLYESNNEIVNAMLLKAREITENDVSNCEKIGEFGCKIIEEISEMKNGDTVNILTHCNAGWLATIDWGTATAPIYKAHKKGIKLHIWVDETRPRNQGAKLTTFELNHEAVPNTLIVDNAGGHLMQHGLVDLVIVGSDRTTYTGDVANKIGTYLKALAANDNNIPFYVALPSSTFDWEIEDGIRDIPIEQRNDEEVSLIDGLYGDKVVEVRVPPNESQTANFAFDVTPSRLVTGLITERGICNANKEDIFRLFPEKKGK